MSAITRRRLLQTGGAAAAGAVVGLRPGAALAADPTGPASSAPPYLRRSAYVGLTDPSFDVTGVSGSSPLTLGAVSDVRPALAGADDAFALAFTGPAPAPLAQGTHTFTHTTLGTFALFVVPVDQPVGDQQYQVIVDRSVSLAPAGASPSPPPASAVGPTPLGGAAAQGAMAHNHLGPAGAVRRVSSRRAGNGMLVEVTLAPGAQVELLRAWLKRGRAVLGVAVVRVHGQRVSFRLHARHRLAGGRYELVIGTTDSRGEVSMTPHPVVLH